MTATAEELADQFFLAREYVVRQGELVTFLMDAKYLVLASHAIQAVNAFIDMWAEKPGLQVDLIYTFMTTRDITKRRYRDARQ